MTLEVEAERLLRCDDCEWTGPVTRYAAGMHGHTWHDHARRPRPAELIGRVDVPVVDQAPIADPHVVKHRVLFHRFNVGAEHL